MICEKDLGGYLKVTQAVYNRMADELSKKIYQYRLMYSLTADASWIKKMIDILPINFPWLEKAGQKLMESQRQGKQIILTGAGIVGRVMRYMFPDICWLCYCDQQSVSERLDGLEVLERQEAIRKYPDALYVVTTVKPVFYNEIENELKEHGIQSIYNIGKILNDSIYDYADLQYFEIFPLEDNEIFIDAGCYDCQSIFEFVKKTDGRFQKIYSFEPEPQLYDICQRTLNQVKLENCELYNLGLWDGEENLHFTSNGDGSKIKEGGEHIIKVTSLDSFFEKKTDKPTFIKMDIEGAELRALQGTKNILKAYAPKLAISVYHKKEDILTIPSYILSVNPDYQFCLRHYTGCYGDTVLYAWVQ